MGFIISFIRPLSKLTARPSVELGCSSQSSCTTTYTPVAAVRPTSTDDRSLQFRKRSIEEGIVKNPEGSGVGRKRALAQDVQRVPQTQASYKQQGLTLLVVLIILLLITLVSITSFKLSNDNLQVVGNMQLRNQTAAAAQAAIENLISRPTFTLVPNVAVTTYASVGGSGTNDIQVVTTPTCVQIQPIPTASLNLNNSDDVACMIGVGQQNGVVGTNSTYSMCANSVWNIQAVATDLTTNATTTISQGEAVRVPITATCP